MSLPWASRQLEDQVRELRAKLTALFATIAGLDDRVSKLEEARGRE